ncbi:hypothetical protein [Jiella avicenniae]|uniref:Uncharacterized protein n=1 Tax=Jiella avicenniae TaxID=2907202 RepID=A0A9X1P4M8_9HYPH|nr:hypothetical protein [Jiella avicenniae]MCE7030947.1 hypothetical protein [Jiella avicenniae]
MRNLIKRAFRSTERDKTVDEERYSRLHDEIEAVLNEIKNEHDGLNRRIRLVSTQIAEKKIWSNARDDAAVSDLDVVLQNRDLEKAVERSRRLTGQVRLVEEILKKLADARNVGTI